MPWDVLAPALGGAASALFGGGGKTTAQLPQDLQGTRQNQIGLMNYLLGFGPDPRQSAGHPQLPTSPTDWKGYQAYAQQLHQASQSPQAGAPAFNMGGPNINPSGTGGAPTIPQGAAGMGGMNGGQVNNTGQPKSDAQTRLESFFGPLGIQSTPLQQQSSGGMSQFLASHPYQQAQNALNQILGNPGEAYRPDFERALASANQTGGRFGSSNALLKSNALNDYNSKAIQAQLGAAQGIQGLGAQQSNDLTSGYNLGTAQANQQASGQQQAIQLLLNQLQTAQSATLGAPVTQQPSGFQNFIQGAGGISQLLPFLMNQQQPTYNG